MSRRQRGGVIDHALKSRSPASVIEVVLGLYSQQQRRRHHGDKNPNTRRRHANHGCDDTGCDSRRAVAEQLESATRPCPNFRQVVMDSCRCLAWCLRLPKILIGTSPSGGGAGAITRSVTALALAAFKALDTLRYIKLTKLAQCRRQLRHY